MLPRTVSSRLFKFWNKSRDFRFLFLEESRSVGDVFSLMTCQVWEDTAVITEAIMVVTEVVDLLPAAATQIELL